MNDMDRWIKNYFLVVARPQTYLNLVYLLLSFPLGLFYFIFLVTGFSLGIPLVILVVGAFILAAVLAASWAMAAFERVLAISLLHVKILPMEKASASTASFWQRVKDYLTNPVTWKGMLYLFCRFPLGVINFSLVVTILAVAVGLIAAPLIYPWATYDLGFAVINSLSDSLLVMVFGLLVTPAGLHLLNFLTHVQGEFARVMLGQASFQGGPAAPVTVPSGEPGDIPGEDQNVVS